MQGGRWRAHAELGAVVKVRFDAVSLCVTAAELSRRLSGGKIRRIQQLGPDLYLFTVFRPRGLDAEETFQGPEVRFIVCLSAASPRIHIAERDYGTADTPTSFCMLLRKHLEGARIASVRTDGLERLVRIDFMPYPDLEAGALAIYLVPNMRTLVLLDGENRVMGEMRHKMRKGTPFEPPTPSRPPAVDLRGGDLVTTLEGEVARDEMLAAMALEKVLPRMAFGLGTVQGREIAVRAGLTPTAPFDASDGPALAAAWDSFWRQVREGPFAPRAVDRDDERVLLPFPFRSQESDKVTRYPTMSRMLEESNAESLGQAGLDALRSTLADAIARHRDKVVRRATAQERDLEKAEKFEQWRIHGDLLIANLYRVPARAASIDLEDYTRDGGPIVRIPLDPDLSPSENARAYYDRYRKAKRGVDAIAEVIERSRAEVEYLDALASAVETAPERDDLREIETQMMAQKLLAGVPRKRPRTASAKPRRFMVDGWDILVGRNPHQNETLSMKMARPEDWWLHARQIPGAHVVIRSQGAQPPPDAVLLAAARLAAGFSRGASSGRVPVDYTRIRHVKKPPGTPAGYVTYSREQTIDVVPAIDIEVVKGGEART